MTFKKIINLIFLFFLLYEIYHSQSEYTWTSFTHASSFTSIVKNDSTYLVGHRGGITIISETGEVIDHITKANSKLPSNEVRAIAIDSLGQWWVGTILGVAKFDGGNWTQYYNRNSIIEKNEISAIQVSSDSTVWIASTRSDVFKVNKNDWEKVNFGFAFIKDIVPSKEGSVFIADGSNIFKVDGENIVKLPLGNLLDQEYALITDLEIDRDGNLWFSSQDGPVAKLNSDNEWESWWISEQPIVNNSISIETKNNVWVGSRDQGLYYFNGTDWSNFTETNLGANLNNIKVMYHAADNSSYFGSSSKFLKKTDDQWENINLSNSGLLHSKVTNIAVSSENKIFIVNGSHLIEYSSDQWEILYTLDEIWPDIKDLQIDDKGNLLIATNGEGIFKYSTDGEVTNYRGSNSALTSSKFNCIEIAPNGNIWFGSHGKGVFKVSDIDDLFDPNKVTNYTTSNSGLPHNAVQSIKVNIHTGDVWFGCDWYGAALFNGIDWQVFDENNTPITYTQIIDIEIDKNNKIWFATYEELVSLFDNQWEVEYDDGISSITSDSNGNLWAGSDERLLIIDGDSLTELNSRFYPFSEQIGDLEFTQDGRLLIGGTGLTILETQLSAVENDLQINELSYSLYDNYPNPFNPSTTIKFDIPEKSDVKIVVYDILGKQVETLLDKFIHPGSYTIRFDGSGLSSGIYFYRIVTKDFIQSKKMLLIK